MGVGRWEKKIATSRFFAVIWLSPDSTAAFLSSGGEYRGNPSPLFTGILPTTDAVIVLTQLAKNSGADRSVNEISVLPQHFKMDEFIDWPIVSRMARTRVQLLKRDVKSCGRTTDITATTDASLGGHPLPSCPFRLAVLRVGRRHPSAGTVSPRTFRRGGPNPAISRQSRQSGMSLGQSVRRCAHAPHARSSRQRHREDRIRLSTRAM